MTTRTMTREEAQKFVTQVRELIRATVLEYESEGTTNTPWVEREADALVELLSPSTACPHCGEKL